MHQRTIVCIALFALTALLTPRRGDAIGLGSGWAMHRADAAQSSYTACMTPRTSAPSGQKWVVNLHHVDADGLDDGSTTTTASDDPTPDTLFSTPLVDSTRGMVIYLRSFRSGSSSQLIALDATTGALVWNTSITGSRDVYGSYSTGMLLADGSTVVTTLGGITRVGADGAVLWTNTAQTYLLAEVFLSPSGNVIIAAPETCGGAPPAAGAPAYPSLMGLDVASGAIVWGIMYPTVERDFCSSPLITTLADGSGRAWISVSSVNYSSWWIAYTFNDTHVRYSDGGSMPDIGNPDINDWGNTVTLPVAAGLPVTPTVLFQYFQGDPACWPQCPVKGDVIVVDVETMKATVSRTDARACDPLGGCGGFSSGIASSSMRLYVMSSAGLLLAFNASETSSTFASTPLWTYNMSSQVYDAPIYLPVVTDSSGNVYAAFGDAVAALDANGKLLWSFTLKSPVPGSPAAIVAQPAYGCDGTLFVPVVTHVRHAPDMFHLVAV